ncbi:MAG: hypothetical protein K6T83_03560 [Alicyclobacillus sp.]|nr:hypothetical protein [Alicyclobacillus sp.]
MSFTLAIVFSAATDSTLINTVPNKERDVIQWGIAVVWFVVGVKLIQTSRRIISDLAAKQTQTDIASCDTDGKRAVAVHIVDSFSFDCFMDIAEQRPDFTEDDRNMLRDYYASVDFDFSVRMITESSAAYFGVTVRKDTGFAEVIAGAMTSSSDEVFVPCMRAIAAKLRTFGVKHLGIYEFLAPSATSLVELGFRQRTNEVMLMKQR